jgi:hypothetical protein
MRTGPTAHTPPSYPLFLALQFFIFGVGKLGAMISYYVNVAFFVGGMLRASRLIF